MDVVRKEIWNCRVASNVIAVNSVLLVQIPWWRTDAPSAETRRYSTSNSIHADWLLTVWLGHPFEAVKRGPSACCDDVIPVLVNRVSFTTGPSRR